MTATTPPLDTAKLLDAALSYAALGRKVFPLQWPVDGKCSCRRADCDSPAKHPKTKHGLNDATSNQETMREWWRDHPQANVGLRMGDGLIAIDVDPDKGGDESIRDLGDLPDTVTALTGGGGRHLIYHADADYPNRAGIAPGVDIRSEGGYIVAPPSQHVSGRLYEWEVGHAPGEMKPAPLPDVLRKLVQNGHTAAPEVGEQIPDGERNSTLASLGGTMRRRGMEEAEIATALLAVNANRCAPPLSEHEVQAIAKSVSRYPPSGNGAAPESPDLDEDIHETDLGNAVRLVKRHGQELRYCFPQKKWYAWDGTRWAPDDTGEVHRRAKETVRAIYHEAAEVEGDRSKKLASHAIRSESEARIAAMVKLARSELPILPAALDADPWAFNVTNGTIDLRTGILRQHRRGDLITMLAPVTYDPDATAPVFMGFLDTIMDGNTGLVTYLQRTLGHTLSGDMSEHRLEMWHGGGGNGKSTLFNAIVDVMGSYARPAAPGLLLTSRHDRHPTEVADLKGARFVYSVEVGEGRGLAEETVKRLTDRTQKARRMREDYSAFEASQVVHRHEP